MVGLLIRLYFDGFRRGLSRTKILGGVYMLLLMMFLGWMAYTLLCEEYGKMAVDNLALVPYAALGLMVSDFILKLVFKRDVMVMNDFLKSRPVDAISWNRFMILSNGLNVWNWLYPLVLIPLVFSVMTIVEAFLSSLLFVAVSMMNGVAVSVIRKGQGWEFKMPVFLVGVVWVPVVALCVVNPFRLSGAIHVTGFIMMCGLMVYGLYRYSCGLHGYVDDARQARNTRFAWGTLDTIEFLGYCRSRRLRIQLVFPLFFVMQLFFGDKDYLSQPVVAIYAVCFISASSIVLGNFMLGIEGNFMDGLWTRPLVFKNLLMGIFRFYALVNTFYTCLVMVISYHSAKMPLYFLVATLLFVIGVVNQALYVSIFFTERLDLFASPFFNSQGNSSSLLGSSLFCFIPMVASCVLIYFVSIEVSSWVMASLGMMGIVLHPLILRRYAEKYLSNRYEHFERYRKQVWN